MSIKHIGKKLLNVVFAMPVFLAAVTHLAVELADLHAGALADPAGGDLEETSLNGLHYTLLQNCICCASLIRK